MPYFTSLFNAFPSHSFKRLALPVAIKHREQQMFVSHRIEDFAGLAETEGLGHLIKDDEISTVVKNQQGLIVKFVKARRWHEYYKVFYGASRTSKEVQSNVRLKELGIAVPDILEYGIALVPTHFFGYTGFYVMRPAPGLGEAHEHLTALPREANTQFANQLIQDLSTLKKHRIIYGDLALRNIFCSATGNLCWIDTGIDEFSPRQQKRFERKWKASIEQFIRWDSPKGLLSDDAWAQIKALA